MKPQVQKIASPLQASLHCFRRVDPRFDFAWHQHPDYELTLITTGRGSRFVGDDMSPYAPGDLVLLGPNLPHTWVSESPAGRAAPGSNTAVVVQFDQSFIDRMIDASPEWRPIMRLLARSARGLHFNRRAAASIIERITHLPDQPSGEQLLSVLQILWSLAQLKPADARALAADTSPLSTGEFDRIDRMCRFIEQHLAEPIGPDDLAAAFHMSASSFSRFFKKATGRSLIQYLNERRIGWACRLMQESDDSITAIAMHVGFTSSSYFNRVFVKCKQIGPRDYRRKFGPGR